MATEPLYTSVVIAYYVNNNPHPDDPERGICPYCRAILRWLDGRPILVGTELYFKLSPLQHIRCWCRWKYKVIPSYQMEDYRVITDDDISYPAWWAGIPEAAKRAAGEDKWPDYYRRLKLEEQARKQAEGELMGWGFLIGAGIGLIAAEYSEGEYERAVRRVRELKGRDDVKEVILREFPNRSGVKALKEYGYI